MDQRERVKEIDCLRSYDNFLSWTGGRLGRCGCGAEVCEKVWGVKLDVRSRDEYNCGERGDLIGSFILFACFRILIFFCRTAVISRVAGIEPTHTVLKTGVLPLNYTPLVVCVARVRQDFHLYG